VCRCNWHSAGSLGWPFPMLKCKYICQIKNTLQFLSHITLKLLWFEIGKMLITVEKNKFIVLLITIFGTCSFHISTCDTQTDGGRTDTYTLDCSAVYMRRAMKMPRDGSANDIFALTTSNFRQPVTRKELCTNISQTFLPEGSILIVRETRISF